MSDHLLQIAIGPVQPFIAASRKTSDLKAGSDILVGLVRAAVETLAKAGCTLIFPALAAASETIPHEKPDAANIVLAVVPSGAQPADLASQCRAAVMHSFDESWVNALAKLKRRGVPLDAGAQVVGNAQLRAFLEFFAAWVELDADYGKAYTEVGVRLAARKASRNFAQPIAGKNLPKSPLNPAFETVLPLESAGAVAPKVREELNLKARETLDAVSLIKRVHLSKFPSNRKIAVLDLLDEAKETAPHELKALSGFATDRDFDEGDVLYLTDDLPEGLRSQAADVRSVFLKAVGRNPRPYYAILHADGDGMGKYLRNLHGKVEHQQFSRALAKFSAGVRGLEQRLPGVVVFAGGDDVLAICPAPKAIEWARRIRDEFDLALSEAPETGGIDKPTLTVGLAVCHVMDDLQSSVNYARGLEKVGKMLPGKDALAVGVRARGGADREAVLPWSLRFPKGNGEEGDGPDRLFETCLELLRPDVAGMSRGFPFEVVALAREMKALQSSVRLESARALEVLRSEFERLCDKKSVQGFDALRFFDYEVDKDGKRHRKSDEPRTAMKWVDGPEALEKLGNAMAIAQFMTREGEE